MRGLVFFVLGWLALSAQAASFDCGKAATKVEKLICSDPELSRLDDELGEQYSEAIEKRPIEKLLPQNQRTWLKERNRCKDVQCLQDAYRHRIADLKDSYKLVMSKDPRLCKAMLALYNEDMRVYGRIRYDQHEMFTNIWKPVDLDEANHPTYGCLQLWRGIFDINNDGKNELVIKQSACLSGILTDSLYVYPSNSDVLNFNPESGKLNPLKDTDNKLGEHEVYYLRDLPGASKAWVGGHLILNPFIWEGTSYISMTDQTPRWIIIAKYKQAEEKQDICYFSDFDIKHQR